jgi:hypothetical protein
MMLAPHLVLCPPSRSRVSSSVSSKEAVQSAMQFSTNLVSPVCPIDVECDCILLLVPRGVL